MYETRGKENYLCANLVEAKTCRKNVKKAKRGGGGCREFGRDGERDGRERERERERERVESKR